jgi:hypothetical protein
MAWKPPIPPQHTLRFQVVINQASIELSGIFGLKFWLGLGLEQNLDLNFGWNNSNTTTANTWISTRAWA